MPQLRALHTLFASTLCVLVSQFFACAYSCRCVSVKRDGIFGKLSHYHSSYTEGRLRLRGGGEGVAGSWDEMKKALDDTKRELAIEVDDGCRELGEELYKVSALQSLTIKGGLTELPKDIERLEALTSLILDGNKLQSLPEGLGNLKHLRVLMLNGNQITALPSSLEKLSKLEVLSVANNKISSLSVLSMCHALERLDADNNEISDEDQLPDFSNLVRLKTLSLAGNQLKSIPGSIGKLQVLETLSVAGNMIERFPVEIGDLSDKKMKVFHFENNPILQGKDGNRMQKIMQKGKKPIKEMLDFIRKSGTQKQMPITTSKSPQEAARDRERKEEEARQREEHRNLLDADVDDEKEATGKFRKMSKRAALIQSGIDAAAKKTQEDEQSSDDSATTNDDDDESDWSSEDSKGHDQAEGVSPLPGDGISRGIVNGEMKEFHGHTGVKHKSEAERMVESGQAPDVATARKMIMKRVGIRAVPEGGGQAGGGSSQSRGGSRGGKSVVSGGARQNVKSGGAPDKDEVIIVRARAVGKLIGKGGATIQKISKDSGARLSISKEEFIHEGDSYVKVVVSGTAAAIEKAKSAVVQADIDVLAF